MLESAGKAANRRARARVAPPWRHDDRHAVINQVPAAISCVDYSPAWRLFKKLQIHGVADIPAFLQQNPLLFKQVYEDIDLVTVNRAFLSMYGTTSLRALRKHYKDSLICAGATSALKLAWAFWRGETVVEWTAAQTAMDGRMILVRKKSTLKLGHRKHWETVLELTEDITEHEDAKKKLAESERYAQALFRLAPVSLWVQDFSGIKKILDKLHGQGIADLRAHLTANPDIMQSCLRTIRVLDFNDQSLELFKATSKQELRENLPRLKGERITEILLDNIMHFWAGRLRFNREVRNYDMNGKPLDLIFQVSVMPGHEHDWSLVLIGKTDFTERKEFEKQLEHISQHDGLTGLYNRFYFNRLIEQIKLHGPFPSSVIFADLNGLKPVNDRLGHDAGDALLCRAAGVLKEAAGQTGVTVRMGGDEFLILLPGRPLAEAEAVMARIAATVAAQKNQDGPVLSLSLGCAACDQAAGVDAMLRAADALMYEAKRGHYANVQHHKAETSNPLQHLSVQ